MVRTKSEVIMEGELTDDGFQFRIVELDAVEREVQAGNGNVQSCTKEW